MMRRSGHRLVASLSCAALLTAAGAASAADDGMNAGDSEKNPVVAEVDGEAIHFQDVMTAAQNLPKRYQSRMKQLFPRFLDRMVEMRVAAGQAEKAGLMDDPEVKTRLARAKRKVLSDVYLQREADKAITEERLRQAYEQYKKNNKPEPEVEARHILVDSEKLANELIGKLDEGAEFVKLAKEESTGPSAKKGGKLGFFAKGDMVESFSQAAFELDKGEYTSEPVKTQYGWHVIKVTDKRTKEPKSFEEMRDKLRQQVKQQVIRSTMKQLKQDANVNTYPERGTKLLEGKGQQGGGGQGN